MNTFNSRTLKKHEQIMDLITFKYEAIKQELKVLKLQNIEYTKDIEELKQENYDLMKQIESYQVLQDIEEKQMEFRHSLTENLDSLNINNSDLNIENKKYKKLVLELNSECNILKNENNKYRIALENDDELKQKRDEIYRNNKLNLERQINELNDEIEILRSEISVINKINSQLTDDDKQYEIMVTTPHKDGNYDKLPITLSLKNIGSTYLYSSSVSITDTPKIDVFERITETVKIEQTQCVSIGYDVDLLMTKIEEIDELKEEIDELNEINDDNEEYIKELKNEIKSLKQKNHELIDKSQCGFRCFSF